MSGNKVAIVTGSSRGIGRAIAHALAATGHAVVVNYVSSAAEAGDVVSAINESGGKAIAVQGDVGEASSVRALFDAAERAFGGVDVLVNNAGLIVYSPIGAATDADFDRIFTLNVRGTFNGMREAATRLRDGGRIINFSSTTLALKPPTYSLYNATKGAIEALTAVVAKELGSRGITVNAVAPGPVETELFLEGKTEADIARLSALAPQKRIGQPGEIADLVVFLASPESAWVNGQVIRANGGAI